MHWYLFICLILFLSFPCFDGLDLIIVNVNYASNFFCLLNFFRWLKSGTYISCLQLIFSGEYTKAMDQDWHSGHFCCFNCDMSLTGHRYILREEHPYCIKCYENLFANTCEECKTPIGTDSKVNIPTVTWAINFVPRPGLACHKFFFRYCCEANIYPCVFSECFRK